MNKFYFPIFYFSHFQISTSEIACFYKKNPVLRWGIQLLGICGIVQLRSSFWLTTCLRSEGESLASSARKMRVFSQKRVACGVVLKLQRVHILEICVSHSWRLYSLPARWQVSQGIFFFRNVRTSFHINVFVPFHSPDTQRNFQFSFSLGRRWRDSFLKV